jgi:thymidine kinase
MVASLTLYCGPMFSGKTEALLNALSHKTLEGHPTLAFKPAFDTKHPGEIVSHSGLRHPADVFEHQDALAATPKPRLVAVDEVQFLTSDSAKTLRAMADAGIETVTAGLDLDFRGEPFPVVRRLRKLADRVVLLRAICARCGSPASHTQRLIRGRAAPLDDPVFTLGGIEIYQPRCRACFSLERNTLWES